MKYYIRGQPNLTHNTCAGFLKMIISKLSKINKEVILWED
jgi:hypothetical protein